MCGITLKSRKTRRLREAFLFKMIFSSLFLWGLTLYFVWLGYYVGKIKQG